MPLEIQPLRLLGRRAALDPLRLGVVDLLDPDAFVLWAEHTALPLWIWHGRPARERGEGREVGRQRLVEGFAGRELCVGLQLELFGPG